MNLILDPVNHAAKVYTAALQSVLIISRNRSPVPLEDRDVDTLTLEESHELLRRHRGREDAAPSVKRESFKR